MRTAKPLHWTELLIPAGVIAYTAIFAFSGWIPHDEGVLAQCAERLLQGELPHVDFDETYTGGLSYLHAWVFQLIGSKLSSMRWMLLAFTATYFTTAYLFFRKRLPLGPSLLLLLLACAWGPANYFAPLPSWYVFFFSYFSMMALHRHIEKGSDLSLFFAGLFGAAGFLMKLPGAYAIGAGYLFLAYRVVTGASRGPKTLARIVGFCAPLAVFKLILPKFSAEPALYFLVPATVAAIPVLVAQHEENAPLPDKPRPSGIREFVVFSLGVAVPILAFALPYLHQGQLRALFEGVFVIPRLRYDLAFYPLPPIQTALLGIPLLAAIWVGLQLRHERTLGTIPRATLHFPLFFLAASLVSPFGWNLYSSVWFTARTIPVIASITALLALTSRQLHGNTETKGTQTTFLVLAFTALTTLIQFPYSFGIYYIYVFGFLVVAAVPAVGSTQRSVRFASQLFILFLTGFGFLLLHPGNIRTKGLHFTTTDNNYPIESTRSGIAVNLADARMYSMVLKLIQESSGAHEIFAGPDSPEVYFLAGKTNPTRILYEFFNPEASTNTTLLASIEKSKADVAVINLAPEFSKPFDDAFHKGLSRLFQKRVRVGKFLVYWERFK